MNPLIVVVSKLFDDTRIALTYLPRLL